MSRRTNSIFEFSSSSRHDDRPQHYQSAELMEIKKLLISRNREMIFSGLNMIQKILCDEAKVLQLIAADVPVFLCDALALLGFDGAKGVNNCLEVMAEREEFYSHNHASFALESVIRSCHFLIKSNTNDSPITESIILMTTIIKGYEMFNRTLGRTTTENFIELLPTLIKTSGSKIEVTYQIALLVKSFLSLPVLKVDRTSEKPFFQSAHTCFEALCRFVGESQSMNPLHEKITLVNFDISCHVLRLLIKTEAMGPQVSVEGCSEEKDFRGDFIASILQFLTEIGANYLGRLPVIEVEADLCKFETFMQALLYVLESSLPQRIQVAQQLGEMGFIHLVTQLISSASESGGRGLGVTCLGVLTQVLLLLSTDTFHQAMEQWPEGGADFCSEVRLGMGQLPLDTGLWLDVLAEPGQPRACKLALLIYLYFYGLTARSPDTLGTIHPHIVAFLQSSTGIESSTILVKTVWFIYVMASLSKQPAVSQYSSDEAQARLVHLLTNTADLGLVYTHHPALLYWAFSAQHVPPAIQCRVVHLWLLNRSPDCRELDNLIRSHAEARYSVLDMLQHGEGAVLVSAFCSVQSLLTQPGSEDIAETIWHLLPTVLAKHSAGSLTEQSAVLVLRLASCRVPTRPSTGNVVRAGCLLPAWLCSGRPVCEAGAVAARRLVHDTLRLSLAAEDCRVLELFLQVPGFAQAVADGIVSADGDIPATSLNTVALICAHEHLASCQVEAGAVARVELRAVLWLLSSADLGCVTASLQLLHHLLTTNFQSAVLRPAHPVDTAFLRHLHLELHNLCFKNVAETRALCWQCLERCAALDSLPPHAMTPALVLSHLPLLGDMSSFLVAWIHRHSRQHGGVGVGGPRSQARRVAPGQFAEAVARVAVALHADPRAEYHALYRKIAESEVAIPLDIREDLQRLYCTDTML